MFGVSPLLKQPVSVVPSPEADVAVLLSVLRVSEEAVLMLRPGVFGSVVLDSVVRLWVLGSVDVASVRVERVASVVEEVVVVVPAVVVEPAVGAEGVEARGPSLAHPPIMRASIKVPGIIVMGFI